MNDAIPILVVDSNPADLEVFSQTLGGEGFTVLSASSAQRGLALTRKHHPGLVLLADDSSSPEETAMQQQVKAEAAREKIPVVQFSSIPPSHSAAVFNAPEANKVFINAAATEDLRERIRTIVRLHKTMAVLRSSEQHQRQLMEMLPEGVILVDPNGRLRDANQQTAALLGYPNRDRLLQKTLFDLIQPQDHARLRSDLASVFKTGSLHNAEFLILKECGDLCPIELSATVWCDQNQQQAGALLLARDLSQQKRAEEIIRSLHGILNQTHDSVVIRDMNGIVHYINQIALRLFGWTLEEFRGRSVREMLFVNAPDFDAAQEELLRRGQWHGELRIRTKGGSSVIVDSRWTLVRGGDGQPRYVVAVASDLTERKRVEWTLREREQVSHRIIDTAFHGFWMFDLKGKLLDTNEAYCRMSGYSHEELLKKHIFDLNADKTSPVTALKHIKQIVQTGSDCFETRHRRKDGSIFDLEISATYLDAGGGYLFAFLNDITERKRLEEERRHFSQHIIAAQEAERARVGRELHDGVNQLIASAKMRLRKVEDRAGRLGPATKAILDRCNQLLVQALEENRRVAHNLHPGDLDMLGLAAVCRNFCREMESRSSMRVKFAEPRRWPRLPAMTELNLFRIVQESLNNVEQHAKAQSAFLKLTFYNNTIVLKIQDDGKGFLPGAGKPTTSAKRGIGLMNMQERAELLGGTFSVASSPRHGTTITVRVPRASA